MMSYIRPIAIIGMAMLYIAGGGDLAAQIAGKTNFPRIMGMNIGAKNYDDLNYLDALSRPDAVILGFYPRWRGKHGQSSIESVVQALKERHPGILVGQYTILSETQDARDHTSADTDKAKKLDREGWWLLDARGRRTQWTNRYNAFEVNIAQWTRTDNDGLRYSEWLARRDYSIYFKPEVGFDIWYLDNALSKPAVKKADWDLDGRNDHNDDENIAIWHRTGHVAEWSEIRKLRPDVFLMGNSDDLSSSEFSGQLHGAFLEALIGAPYSMERWQGWDKMMERYHTTLKHTAPPHIVGFNVHGKANDYQRMRYGLASCLMDDGYFSYTDERAGYSSVVWFDEYNINLGNPLEPPQVKPWERNVYRRAYQYGLVLVNPGMLPQTVTIQAGYRHFIGNQDPDVNNGDAVSSITLQSKDGIILIKKTN